MEKERDLFELLDDDCVDRIMKFINMDDQEFYDTYVASMSEEEQERFFAECPDFQRPGEKK